MAKLKDQYDFNSMVSEEELQMRLEVDLATAKLEYYQVFHFGNQKRFNEPTTWEEYWELQKEMIIECHEATKASKISGIAIRRIKRYPEFAEKHMLAK